MKNQFSNTVYISTSGDRFLYEKETRYIFMSFSTRDDIDAVCLKRTTNAMMKRCPYFHTKKGINNGLYCLMQVEEELPVTENFGYILTDDERNRGFLLSVSFYKNKIYLCFHHALTDAHGALLFTLSFAAEYLRNLTKQNLSVPFELNPNTKCDEREYENPYNFLTHQERLIDCPSARGFIIPNNDINSNTKRLRLYIQKDRILEYCSCAESSFASVLSMIFYLAIDKIYPVKDNPVRIYCPVDMRSMLGCEKTLQHCCYGIYFWFPNELKKLSFNQQLTCLKGMLMLQTDKSYLINKMQKQKENHENLCSKANSIEEIENHYNSVHYYEPLMSYIKTIDFGDIAPYITDFDINTPVRDAIGMNLYSYCIDNKCVINLRSKLKENYIFTAFLDTLQSLSIPYKIIDENGLDTSDFHLDNWLGEE